MTVKLTLTTAWTSMVSTPANNANDQILNSALDKTKDFTQGPSSVLPDELTYLVAAFSPSQTLPSRSKAYLVLSAFCQGIRSPSPERTAKKDDPFSDPATNTLVNAFHPHISSYFTKTRESDILEGLSFMIALFQVDGQSASALFQKEGFVEFVTDSVDLCSSSQLFLEVAHLLGQACGHKSCRAIIPSELTAWLESKTRQTKDPSLRAAASVSLVKLSHGSAADASAVSGATADTSQSATNDEEMAKTLKAMILGGNTGAFQNDAVEGLVYLSVNSAVKENLAHNSAFLKKLFSLVPRRQPLPDSTFLYGLLAIILNLCAYKPQLTEEQAQMEKLRRMAKSSSGAAADDDELEDNDHVKARAHLLIASGALGVLATAASVDSQGIRVTTGKAYLNLVQDLENRGKVLQSGGTKALTTLMRQSLASPSSSKNAPQLDEADLYAIQALARLAITASPFQVFGPNEGAMYDAIRPFALLLLHDSATLLGQFEVMMALTNVASHSAECATRIANTTGLLNRVETSILSDHTLLRRAAVELICNLIGGSEEVFERYGGEKSKMSQSKLQILVAMSDVGDEPTRLAASGALAIVSTAPSASHALFELQIERHRVFSVLARLIDPSFVAEGEIEDEDNEDAVELAGNSGLVHRGITCIRNILLHSTDGFSREQVVVEADKAGFKEVVGKILKGEVGPPNPVITNLAVEVLQFLLGNKKGQ